MADLSDKAQEAVGRAKQAAGDLTGNDYLRADGADDVAQAHLKQGVEEVADKAADAIDAVTDASSSALDAAAAKAEDVKQSVGEVVDSARRLDLDDAASVLGDKRVVTGVIVAAVGAAAVAIVVRRKRGRRSTAKRAAAAGIGRALTRC